MHDEMTAYVQITHVEPAGDAGATEEDDFWLHAKTKKFKFETRLTERDGKLEDVTKQGKRRIFLIGRYSVFLRTGG